MRKDGAKIFTGEKMVASTAFTRLIADEERRKQRKAERLEKKLNRKPRKWPKKAKHGKPGREPVKHLRSLPYRQYLRSTHWRIIRTEAVKLAENRCSVCGSDSNLNVHHLTYERLGQELQSDLQVLCYGCHQRVHERDRAYRIRKKLRCLFLSTPTQS